MTPKTLERAASKTALHTGLSRELVLHISAQKNEPGWMRERRLHAFETLQTMELPQWGPDLSRLHLATLTYYVEPSIAEQSEWADVPEEIWKTFNDLGIPKAEQEFLGGVGAQYDSGVVYHHIKKELEAQGVVFENMDVAVEKYPDLVEEHFMTRCVPPLDHYFAAMHAAVWSGGTFIYVPKGVCVKEPLQAYFRMNRSGSGQFEHTLIIVDEGAAVTYIEGCSAPRYNASSLHAGCVELFVNKGAHLKYVSIENWSHNTYNLNTKRALVYDGAHMEWVGGNMGSGVTMLYPSSILLGEGARSDNLGVVFAGKAQVQDTGAKAIHVAPNTHSTIRSKSVSKDGGVANYRGLIKVTKRAQGSSSSLVCESLLLDDESEANTYPTVENKQQDVEISHEATIGKIGEQEIFYLQSRGLSRDDAVRLIIHGFANPIVKALPLEYAVELNKLIELETEGRS